MKIIYLAAGLLALALGAVGIVLPILPSTPFLLLAAFCFARSSQRLNTWFKGTKLYKNNLETFVSGRGMTRAAKLRIITSVTVIMAIAFYFMRGTNVGRICLAVVWVVHVIALCFFVKTCPSEKAEEVPDDASDLICAADDGLEGISGEAAAAAGILQSAVRSEEVRGRSAGRRVSVPAADKNGGMHQ